MPYLDPVNRALPFQSGSDTSRDAAVRAAKFIGQQGLDVLAWFEARGPQGGTQKECAAALDIGRPSICARVRALEEAGRVRKTEARRGGCAVYEFCTVTLAPA